MKITASILYDYIQCPHKVWRDKHGNQAEKTKESNPFVELLWNKGVQHEERIVRKLGDYLDLSDGTLEERFKKTIEAMQSDTEIIYQGVIRHENYLGIPDLLKRMPDGSYIPVDIKSGMAFYLQKPPATKELKKILKEWYNNSKYVSSLLLSNISNHSKSDPFEEKIINEIPFALN